MTMGPIPAEVTAASSVLDRESATWTPEAQEAWRRVRGFIRGRQRESQQMVAVLSEAAQRTVAVRDHAQAALDAMAGVFSPGDDKPPPEDR